MSSINNLLAVYFTGGIPWGIKAQKLEKLLQRGEPPLQASSRMPPERLARQIWLHYFNDYLFKRQVITEDEWRRMRRLIGED